MQPSEGPRGYQGGYLIGFVMISVVALRAMLFYREHASLAPALVLITAYTLLYILEPWAARHFPWQAYIYFPVQAALVFGVSNLRPFLDFHTVLYFPLTLQVFRAFSIRAALGWTILFFLLLSITLIPGLGLWEGLALILLNLASGTFLISYDSLFSRAQADRAESERLLADLQAAHRRLKQVTHQAEELAAARERNRLARELHDSVSQILFAVTLTSRSARLLLERDPARAPGEITRLQQMTAEALHQLRSLIAELHPR
jgi:signal transduction histidine kinase